MPSYILMYSYFLFTYSQLESREACLKQFASTLGKEVLGQLSQLYRALVWEGFILLAVAADEEKKKREKHLEVEKMDTSTAKDADSTASTLVGEEEIVSKLSPAGGNHSWQLVKSLKHLTPLLMLTSRVGRSLAEFMNLLIRICITPLVRNPHRSRYRDETECLGQLSSVLKDLNHFLESPNSAKSVLLEEMGPLPNASEAVKTPRGNPLLHKLSVANSYMQLFVYFFKACCTTYTNVS